MFVFVFRRQQTGVYSGLREKSLWKRERLRNRGWGGGGRNDEKTCPERIF